MSDYSVVVLCKCTIGKAQYNVLGNVTAAGLDDFNAQKQPEQCKGEPQRIENSKRVQIDLRGPQLHFLRLFLRVKSSANH
jgi:hypothetical protein